MLLSFELLQEAGLRLPDPVGQTASIIGALIVGQSAVEARIVSPIAVIIVALAGISWLHHAQPRLGLGHQAAALPLCPGRGRAGPVRLMAALALLIWHLASLESFGAPYLSPLTDADGRGALRALLRRPNRCNRLRSPVIAGENRRRRGNGGEK